MADRRHIRKVVAIADMLFPHEQYYIVGNMYVARVFSNYTIHKQMLVSTVTTGDIL